MSNQPGRFFDNPAFCEYVFLLVEIERLIREGRNDLPEGEAIYEEMDAPADKLDRDEMNAVSAFAADLTRMSERYRAVLLPTQAALPTAANGSANHPPPLAEPPARSRSTDPADSPKELVP